MNRLRPWQEKSVEHLLGVLARHGAAADLSDPGTGKTYTATALVKRLGKGTCVVAPKAVLPAWHKVARFNETEVDAVNYEMLRTGKTAYGRWAVPKGKRKERFRWHPGIEFLIFDEAHRCAGLDTSHSEMLIAARRQGIQTLLLSATLADTPLELKAAGYVLGLHDGDEDQQLTLGNFHKRLVSFYSWCRKHGCHPAGFSQLAFVGTEEQRAAHMAKINSTLLPDRGTRVRIADLGDAFPKTQITAELYDAGDADRVNGLYATMADALKVLEDRKALDKCPWNPSLQLLRARQEIELIKVPIAVELAQDTIAQGRSVAIFVNFRATVVELCKRLKTNCFVDGTQTGIEGAAHRQSCIDGFLQDRERTIICNNDAGGVGIGLQDIRGVYPHDSIIFPGFSGKGFRQVTGRVHRDDAKSASLQRVICLAGTVEERVAKTLTRKLSCLDALNDSDFMP